MKVRSPPLTDGRVDGVMNHACLSGCLRGRLNLVLEKQKIELCVNEENVSVGSIIGVIKKRRKMADNGK